MKKFLIGIFISLLLVFSVSAASNLNSLVSGQEKVYTIDGETYVVEAIYIGDDEVRLKINGETTSILEEGEDYTISGITVSISDIYGSDSAVSFQVNDQVATVVSTTVNCRDTDGGQDIYTQGETTYNLKFSKEYWYNLKDSCSGNTLNEYHCTSNGLAQTTYHTCQYGCSSGACKVSGSSGGGTGAGYSGGGTGSGGGGPGTIVVSEKGRTIGNFNAPIHMVMYADLQGPFGARWFDQTYNLLIKNYVNPGHLKITFKHMPLAFHPNAYLAHQFAQCAAWENEFFDYIQLVFDNQLNMEYKDLLDYWKKVGLANEAVVNNCVYDDNTIKEIEDDIKEAASKGVRGVPTFFINGKIVNGNQPYQTFADIIDKFLRDGTIAPTPVPKYIRPTVIAPTNGEGYSAKLGQKFKLNPGMKISIIGADMKIKHEGYQSECQARPAKAVYIESVIAEKGARPIVTSYYIEEQEAVDDEEDAKDDYYNSLEAKELGVGEKEIGEPIELRDVEIRAIKLIPSTGGVSAGGPGCRIFANIEVKRNCAETGTGSKCTEDEFKIYIGQTINVANYKLVFMEKYSETGIFMVADSLTQIPEGEYEEEGQIPTCYDRIHNDGETAVDCGGPCKACDQPSRECLTGCFTDNKCLPFGTRLVEDTVGKYCSISGKFSDQLAEDKVCQNDYECTTNSCISGACVDIKKQLDEQQTLINKILAWLRGMFS